MAALSDEEQQVLTALQAAGVPEPDNLRGFLARLHIASYRTPDDFKRAMRDGLATAGLPAALVDSVMACQADAAGAGAGTAPAGATSLYSLADSRQYNSFLKSLDKNQEQFSMLPREGIVELDAGVTFPGTALRQLYVRGCYVDLLDADADYRTRNPEYKLTYITGNPGVGKSCCLLVHMCQCLVRGATVIFHVCRFQEAPLVYRLKIGEDSRVAESELPFLQELNDPDVCYFIDGGIPRLDAFEAKCWAYTSPKGMSHRALKEVHLRANKLMMPLFTLDELLAVRESVQAYQQMVTEVQLMHFFKLAGGSGRIVLEQPTFQGLTFQGLVQLLTTKVQELNGARAQVISELAACGYSSICEALFHWHVLTEEEMNLSSSVSAACSQPSSPSTAQLPSSSSPVVAQLPSCKSSAAAAFQPSSSSAITQLPSSSSLAAARLPSSSSLAATACQHSSSPATAQLPSSSLPASTACQQPSSPATAQLPSSSLPASTACQHSSSPATAQLPSSSSPATSQQQQQQPSGGNNQPDNRLRQFRHHRLQYASEYVAALVARHTTLSVRNMCAQFLLTAAGGIDKRSLAGAQFERLVHATLPCVPKGGVTLNLKLLETGTEFLLRLPASSPRVFEDIHSAAADSCADCSTYLMPSIPNFPAIDCLLSRKVLLQVALGSQHTINRPGIDEICRVVTEDADKFSKAHKALERMLEPLPPADGGCGATKRQRKRNKDTTESTTSKTNCNLPLLVFVTPDYQYHNWTKLQLYTDAQPRSPLVEQAVMKFPSAWAANGFIQ